MKKTDWPFKRLWQNKVRVLGMAFLMLSALVYLAAGFFIFSEFFMVLEQDNGFAAATKTILDREKAAAVVAFIAAPLVAWRTRTAFEEHITGRLNKAVEQLSAVRRVPCREVNEKKEWVTWEEEKPNIEARLGGLYALERIAQDSKRDHFSVMEMICTYVRRNSPITVNEAALAQTQDSSTMEIAPRPQRPDIQQAIRILGRRYYSLKAEMRNGYAPRLQNTDLTGTDLEDLVLRWAWLGSGNFRFSYLVGADLTGCLVGWSRF